MIEYHWRQGVRVTPQKEISNWRRSARVTLEKEILIRRIATRDGSIFYKA